MAQKTPERRGLGRGLSALMADVNPETPAEQQGQTAARRPDTHVAIDRLHPNPNQPRRDFVKENLEELAASIREKGVIQPLIVRPDPHQGGAYQIVAGERRWRAAQMAQLHELPVLIRDFDDTEVLEVAIIENIQRADLNPVEEAAGYRRLMEQFGHTQENLARALGKSRSHIANLMRLLGLPEEVLGYLREGMLSAGHARALITADDPVGIAKQIVAKGLSVREVERLVKAPKPGAGPKPRAAAPEKDADTRALEQDLAANTGLRVTIDHKPGGESGQVVIRYGTLEELDALCQALTAMR
ncbi:chromosome partitioning protein ParB [Maritimibacter sp. 55A14]|uniref:ParB/RepB/Spo0J family partition protein n=1 Tax=Maritimibacter sp. 55A14 TaxID=2174844 RepID=UPI000D612528|nr:ParB/RepB/Spo0J family partition protein [Maritimibacter sp. 55A14]PWE33571.1 chromosome partitioning protein ParB [Maritimibacter sp. 55A14]